MGMDRKLQACLEQELTDTKEELKRCKQQQSDLIEWLKRQAHVTLNASAHQTYYKVIKYLEKPYESN